MTQSSTLPPDDRDAHKVRIALGLQSIRLAAGHGSLKRLAQATGVSQALWKRWEDPDDSASVSLPDVATLAQREPAIARQIVRLLTKSMGLDLAPTEQPAGLCDDLKACGAVLSSAGDLATHHAAACSDDHLDPDEAAAGLPKAQAAKRAAAALEQRYLDVLKTRSAKVLRLADGGAA